MVRKNLHACYLPEDLFSKFNNQISAIEASEPQLEFRKIKCLEVCIKTLESFKDWFTAQIAIQEAEGLQSLDEVKQKLFKHVTFVAELYSLKIWNEHPSSNKIVLFQHFNNSIKSKSKATPRELEVIAELFEGNTYRGIGDKLFISESTVKKHIENIYSKFNVSNKIELMNLISSAPVIH